MKMPKFNLRRGKAQEKQEVAKENDSDTEPEQQNGGDLEMGETQVDRDSSRRNRSRNEDRGGSSKRDDDDDDDDDKEQEEQLKLKRQQDEEEDEGSNQSGENTGLLERDGSPRRNSPTRSRRRQRRASSADGDGGDDEENENDSDERDRSGGRANHRDRQSGERPNIPRLDAPPPAGARGGPGEPAIAGSGGRLCCTLSGVASLGTWLLLVNVVVCVQVVCVMDGQCFDYRRRDPAVHDFARTILPWLLLTVLLFAVPLGFYSSDRMDLVLRARQRLGDNGSRGKPRMSAEQEAFIRRKIDGKFSSCSTAEGCRVQPGAVTFVWCNVAICAGLAAFTFIATMVVYSDQDTIRTDVTDKWDSYGDQTITYYTRNGQLSDKKGKKRLGDAAETYAAHVLVFACTTFIALLVPAASSFAFVCKNMFGCFSDFR